MGRRSRQDRPGAWHHVFVRGAGGDDIYKDDFDRQTFFKQLEAQVLCGRLVVFAYVLMSNHFHLLVMSPTGELAIAMRDLLRPFVLLTNPRLGRDGPLFRSRFGSKPVQTHGYRTNVLRYIDRNPERAGMVEQSVDYRFGSAFHLHRGSVPTWLDASWAKTVLFESRGIVGLPVGAYGVGTVTEFDVEQDQLIEARMRAAGVLDPLAQVAATTEARRRFLGGYFAAVPNGRTGYSELPTAASLTVLRVCQDFSGFEEAWSRRSPRASREWGQILSVGLLERMTGQTRAELGQQLGRCPANVGRTVALHRELLAAETDYRELAHRAAEEILWGRERVAFC